MSLSPTTCVAFMAVPSESLLHLTDLCLKPERGREKRAKSRQLLTPPPLPLQTSVLTARTENDGRGDSAKQK